MKAGACPGFFVRVSIFDPGSFAVLYEGLNSFTQHWQLAVKEMLRARHD
jgi:hypothetical protein